jgi:pyridoxamine 5'-phosphate oxidase
MAQGSREIRDPFEWFDTWFKDGLATGLENADAMTLSTIALDGRPSSRIVLLKAVEEGRFCFFTNYDSRKAREMSANPFVTLTFLWPTLNRQVRVEGRVDKLPRERSEAYFATRPRGSQIGAWASSQSSRINAYSDLEARVREYEAKFKDQVVPCPPNWGGYGVLPARIEFWTGKPSRLHERMVYERGQKSVDAHEAAWSTHLLSP